MTHATADTVVELRRLYHELNEREAANIEQALADDAFSFDAAQRALARELHELARLVHDVLNVHRGLPDEPELRRIALLAEKAPVTSAKDLEAIRAGVRTRPA